MLMSGVSYHDTNSRREIGNEINTLGVRNDALTAGGISAFVLRIALHRRFARFRDTPAIVVVRVMTDVRGFFQCTEMPDAD
jgi:hypothetical protein